MIQGLIVGAACAALFGLLCRIDAMTWRTHRWHVVAGHVALAVAVIFSGAEAAQSSAGLIESCVVVGAVCWLGWTWPEWQEGPPERTQSRPMPLDGAEA